MKQQDTVVIDANIIKGVFEEDLHGSCTLTSSAVDFLTHLREQECRIVLDEEGHIAAEWQGCVDQDWYEAWFSELAGQTSLTMLACDPCRSLLKKLRVDYGFPTGENVWLVKASATAAGAYGECVLATEDMDFYEPRLKGNASERQKHLDGTKRGAVARQLERTDVIVLPLCRC